MFLKTIRARVDGYLLAACTIIAFAVALRLVLTALGWPQTNSDEATMGLMALHILKNGEHPIFFYGQAYMGATEAYIASAIFRILGSSVFALRVVTIGLFAVFLACMYALSSLLYSRKVALVTLLLLALGSNIMLYTEVAAIGGYPELLACGSLLFLLTARLAVAGAAQQQAPRAGLWKRLLAFGCWGLVAGVGFWSDYIMLLIIVLAGVVLALFCWRLLLRGAIVPLVLGFALGTFPLIVYNLHSPSSTNTLAVIWSLHNNFSALLVQAHVSGSFPYLPGVLGTLLVSLPSITGAPSFCYDQSLILHGYPTMQAFQCSNMQGQWGLVILDGAWSLGFLTLWVIGVMHAVSGIVREWRAWPLQHLGEGGQGGEGVQGERRALVLHSCHLMLLASAGATLAQFAASPVAAVFPTNARYLIAVLISTPALIGPLVDISAARGRRQGSRAVTLQRWGKAAALALIAAVLLLGTLSIIGEIAPAQAYARQQQNLISNLEHIHATRIYSDYWVCDRVMFETNENILCGVINGQLQPDHNRSPYDYAVVSADPRATYVFLSGSPQLTSLGQRSALTGQRYQHFFFDGYEVWQPV